MKETQQQAIEQFMGEQFIEWLLNHIAEVASGWPQLTTMRLARVRIEKIRKFMLQQFLAHEAFLGGREGEPGFLGFAIANLSESNDPLAESALEILEKKQQEELAGRKSRELWLKLLHGLGISDEEITRAEPKEPTRHYVAELSDVYSNLDWQTAVGAFIASERALAEEYDAVAAMLRNNTQVSEVDLEILRQTFKPGHILDKVAFDQENKLLVLNGVRRQLEARAEFYKGLAKYLEESKT